MDDTRLVLDELLWLFLLKLPETSLHLLVSPTHSGKHKFRAGALLASYMGGDSNGYPRASG